MATLQYQSPVQVTVTLDNKVLDRYPTMVITTITPIPSSVSSTSKSLVQHQADSKQTYHACFSLDDSTSIKFGHQPTSEIPIQSTNAGIPPSSTKPNVGSHYHTEVRQLTTDIRAATINNITQLLVDLQISMTVETPSKVIDEDVVMNKIEQDLYHLISHAFGTPKSSRNSKQQAQSRKRQRTAWHPKRSTPSGSSSRSNPSAFRTDENF